MTFDEVVADITDSLADYTGLGIALTRKQAATLLDGIKALRPEAATNKAMPSLEEVERTMKDAARYRWLRDVSVPPHNFYLSVPDEFKDDRYTPQQVDAAIDAALSPLAHKEKP